MRYWPLLVLLAVALLTGCPKGDQPASGDPAAQVPPASQTGDTPAADETGSTTDATTTPTTTADATPAANPADDAAKLAKLEGEWFAMFGRHEVGIVENAWEKQQRLKFDKHGKAQFTFDLSGKMSSLDCDYSLTGSTLELSFAGDKAVSTGLSKIAPLGISRNEEVGLMKQAGRNEEIGLEKSGPGDTTGAARTVKKLSFSVTDEYLVLTDEISHIMIYGRYVPATEAKVPDVTGKWMVALEGEELQGTATIADGVLTIDMGQATRFTGKAVSGYFVGQLKRPSGLSLTALFPTADGRLVGTFSPDPYVEARTDLILSRP